MADEVLRIIVRGDGTAKVAGDLQKIGRAGDGAARSALRLTKSIAGIAAGAAGAAGLTAAVRQAIELNDRYTALSNRIRIFADSQGAANATVNELLKVADRSRTSLDGVSDLYSRLSLAAEGFGYTQERVLGVTELVSKAIGLTTGSSQAATGAIIQFAQAIGGDFKSAAQEMNSLMEQSPGLAKLVAAGLGVETAALKELGKEGKLGTDLVIRGLESQQAVLDNWVQRTAPTTAAATQKVTDATTLLVGRFFEQTDAGRVVNDTITDLAHSISGLATNTQRMDEIAKPFVNTLREMVALAQRASFNFGGNSDILGLGGVSNSDITERLGKLREMQRVLQTPRDQLGFGDKMRRDLISPEFGAGDAFGLERIKADISRFESEQQRRFLSKAQAPPGWVAPVPAAADDPFRTTPNPAPAANLSGALGGATEKELAKIAKASDDAVAAFQALRGEYDPLVAAGNQYAESLRVIDEALRTGRISQDAARTTLTGVTAELEKARNASKTAAFEGFEALRAQLDPAVAAGNAYAAAIRGINDALVHNPALQGEAARIVGLATENYTTALKEIDKGKKPLSETGQIAQAMSGQFTNALDSLVNFANTGQASISEFAASAVSDLQRVALQMLLVQGLQGLAGVVPGGATGGAGSLLTTMATAIGGARADGGPVRRGKAFLVGEEGPELFVPPSRGTILPNGTGGGPKPVVSVTNMFDGNQMVDAMKTYEGEEVILQMLQRNRGKLREIMG